MHRLRPYFEWKLEQPGYQPGDSTDDREKREKITLSLGEYLAAKAAFMDKRDKFYNKR